MRPIIFVLFLATTAYGQSLVENAAAAAGGSVGGVAGKKVGEGISNIFGKVDKVASKAAKTAASPRQDSDDALMEVGPGVPKGAPSVPPPPPLHHAAAHRSARVHTPVHAEPEPLPAPVVRVPPPAPREASAADLRKITTGMQRANVMALAPPSVRITMFDDGHLLEIYRYIAGDNNIGTVRLVDGSVQTIQLQHP